MQNKEILVQNMAVLPHPTLNVITNKIPQDISPTATSAAQTTTNPDFPTTPEDTVSTVTLESPPLVQTDDLRGKGLLGEGNHKSSNDRLSNTSTDSSNEGPKPSRKVSFQGNYALIHSVRMKNKETTSGSLSARESLQSVNSQTRTSTSIYSTSVVSHSHSIQPSSVKIEPDPLSLKSETDSGSSEVKLPSLDGSLNSGARIGMTVYENDVWHLSSNPAMNGIEKPRTTSRSLPRRTSNNSDRDVEASRLVYSNTKKSSTTIKSLKSSSSISQLKTGPSNRLPNQEVGIVNLNGPSTGIRRHSEGGDEVSIQRTSYRRSSVEESTTPRDSVHKTTRSSQSSQATIEKPMFLMYPRKGIRTSASQASIPNASASIKLNTQQSSSYNVKGSQNNVLLQQAFSQSVISQKNSLAIISNNGEEYHQVQEVEDMIDETDQFDERLLIKKIPLKGSLQILTQVENHISEDLVSPGFSMISKTPSPAESVAIDNNQAYYEYLMFQQRHASNNFITQIGSRDIIYDTEEKAPKYIGPFLMGEVIGKGAFGKVKEGLCSETLQRVAIKIISKKRLRKVANGVKNVIQEIKLLRRLKHKNVITLIDVYCKVEDVESGKVGVFNWFTSIEDEPIMWTQDDGTEEECNVEIIKWYIVFEYCPSSLQTVLEQETSGKLDIATAHRFFVQLAEGLDYLHSQSVVHRDIKPGNMLLTADGVIKISDFGIAEQFDMYDGNSMVSSEFAGTHQFIPPEIADGTTSFEGTKVDIWALAVTLFNMVTGSLPFLFDEEGNLLLLYESIMKCEFTIPSYVDPLCRNIINEMLQKDPSKRLNLTEILNHPFSKSFYENRQKTLILSYPQLTKDSPDEITRTGSTSTSKFIIPCETTMIPKISGLYKKIIEENLARNGKMIDRLRDSLKMNLNDSQESDNTNQKSVKGLPKMTTWIISKISGGRNSKSGDSSTSSFNAANNKGSKPSSVSSGKNGSKKSSKVTK